MKLGLIQTKQNELYDFENKNLFLSHKQVISLQEEMAEQTIALILRACKSDCDVIVTTEAVNFCGLDKNIDCNYEDVIPEGNAPLFIRISEIAKKYKKYIALGTYNKRKGKLYNSVFIYDKEGRNCLCYDKIHLAGAENDRLTPGDTYKVWESEFGKIGIAICFDMQFPETCRELMLQGADLIICPTWGWEGIYAHARAYENGIYVAGAMGIPYMGDITGIRNPSEVISPEGKILCSGSRDKAEVVCCELDIRDCKAYRNMRLANRHPGTYRLIGK